MRSLWWWTTLALHCSLPLWTSSSSLPHSIYSIAPLHLHPNPYLSSCSYGCVPAYVFSLGANMDIDSRRQSCWSSLLYLPHFYIWSWLFRTCQFSLAAESQENLLLRARIINTCQLAPIFLCVFWRLYYILYFQGKSFNNWGIYFVIKSFLSSIIVHFIWKSKNFKKKRKFIRYLDQH